MLKYGHVTNVPKSNADGCAGFADWFMMFIDIRLMM
jgi:hypothetical protein